MVSWAETLAQHSTDEARCLALVDYVWSKVFQTSDKALGVGQGGRASPLSASSPVLASLADGAEDIQYGAAVVFEWLFKIFLEIYMKNKWFWVFWVPSVVHGAKHGPIIGPLS